MKKRLMLYLALVTAPAITAWADVDLHAKFVANGGDSEAAEMMIKQLDEDSQDIPAWLYSYLPSGFETMDDRATGGPDSFGYTWADSDQAGGPAYSWVDITTIGTNLAITGDDVLSAAITLPWSFPFYGTNQSTMKVCTNGHIQFGTGTSTAYSNAAIPAAVVPNNALYPFWDDMSSAATCTTTTTRPTTGSSWSGPTCAAPAAPSPTATRWRPSSPPTAMWSTSTRR